MDAESLIMLQTIYHATGDCVNDFASATSTRPLPDKDEKYLPGQAGDYRRMAKDNAISSSLPFAYLGRS